MRRYAIWLSCDLDVQDCVNEATRQFSAFKSACNSSHSTAYLCSPVSPNLREAVYCAGIRHGSVADWTFLWGLYGREQVSAERQHILYGLSCTREPWLLIRLLNEALAATTIRSQDARYAFQDVGNNPVGQDVTWTYLSEKWDQIHEKYAKTFGFSIGRIVRAATAAFNTQYQVNQLESFMATENLGSAKATFASQLEKAKSNVQWVNSYAGIIMDWIKSKNFPSA